MALIEWLENTFLIMLDFVIFEKPKVFVTKTPPGMVPFLVADVVGFNRSPLTGFRKWVR